MIKFIFLMLIMSLFSYTDVHAECDANSIRSAAGRVNIHYNLVERDYYYFDLVFSNLSDKIGIVSDDIPDFALTGNTDKTHHVEKIYGIDQIKKARFKIFALNQNCVPGTIREIDVSLPKYNELSNTQACKKDSSKNGCQKLIFTEDVVTYNKMSKRISIENKDKTSSDKEVAKIFKIRDKYYIIGGVVLVIITVTGIFVYSFKKRRV